MNTLKLETVADDFRAPIDMDAVAREATRTKLYFKLVFQCHAEEFRWEGVAGSRGLAVAVARAALHEQFAGFNPYKSALISCLQEVVS